MLIVSQDKKKIINLNTIQYINIFQNQLWAGNIPNNQLGDFDTVLGTYETEERAKEVLQEIIGKYKQWNKDANNAVTIIPKVYEMPKE